MNGGKSVPFSVNSGFLFGCAAVVIAFVIAQSLFFFIKAWRRAKVIGMNKRILTQVVSSSAIFTIAPAVSIFLGIITLSKFLGLPLPWLRLSVVGALTYELPAATAAANAAGVDLSTTVTDPQVFATIAWVMTLGIIPGIIVIPIFLRKIQNSVAKIGNKDKRWGDIFMNSLFIGLVSAFLGLVFADIRVMPSGLIPVFVAGVSALLMTGMGLLIRKGKMAWLETYALPVSMLVSMGLAIPISTWLS
jgi:hypothetical protein